MCESDSSFRWGDENGVRYARTKSTLVAQTGFPRAHKMKSLALRLDGIHIARYDQRASAYLAFQ